MTNVQDIESAIANLTPERLAEIRAWFDEFEARLFDRAIARDIAEGKLDKVAAEALAELEAGRCREL
jgi:hypothetical protein